MTAPAVLFITTSFPPAVGGGPVRNAAVARGLAERGWSVTVVTGRKRSPRFDDPSLLVDMPQNVRVIRAVSPDVASVARRLRHARGSAASGGASVRRSGLRRGVLSLMVPDPDLPWIPFAVAAARSVRPPFALLSAGPPHSAHLAALAVRGRASRWVIDAHDPWADHPFPVSTSRVRYAVDRWLEERAMHSADFVISATDAQTGQLRRRYRRTEGFVTVASGFLEREFATLQPLRGERRRIVHLGSFYGPRSPGAFLAALERLVAADALPGWEALLAGYADPESAALIERAVRSPVLGPVLTYRPHVPREESLRLMLGADVLLLVTDPAGGGRDLIPLKTFEYLRAQRPILALVPDGETARLLRRTGGARIVAPDDVPAIAAALGEMSGPADAQPLPRADVVPELSMERAVDRIAELLRGAA